MPAHQSPSANDSGRIPRKRQARLDDNGEPAGVPAPKKRKSVEKDGPKKKGPANKKTQSSAPLKKTPSAEIPASDHDTNEADGTIVIVSSDDEEDVAEAVEAPEEDDEAQLGAYSNLYSYIKVAELGKTKRECPKSGPHPFTCSLKKLPKSSIKVAGVLMSLNARLVNAKDVTAVTSIGSLTRVMQTRPAIFFVTQKFAGVLKPWKQLLPRRILMLREKY